jgi:hypothetical protein
LTAGLRPQAVAIARTEPMDAASVGAVPGAYAELELVPFVDFAELTVGYPAADPADPAGSQHAIADLGSPGWLAL